ncbi:putative ABC transporter substrate-binding protein [Oscillibacter valericigenes Sjm18-20]|nr:putative ABC transporter substrate-binding protein [Oscillibacter valericigenes Sjm18-20]
MKKKLSIKVPAFLLAVVLSLSLLSGCGNSAAQSSSAASVPAASSLAASSSASASDTQQITDMIGNQVTIPAAVSKVFCTSPIGTYIMYTLAPDKLLGWNTELSDGAKKYISAEYQDLPVLGGTMGGQNTFNTEAITALAPDIILDFSYNNQVSDMVTQLGQQTGIPVVTLDSSLTGTPDAYRLLGQILGVEDRGNELADYAKKALDNISSMVSKVPDSEKVKIYYVESADGLKTDGTDSMHTEVINFVNATNVVDMDTSASGKGTAVSMEQVLNWNPDVILANSGMGGSDFISTVYSDSTWSGISAVQNHRIYVPASLPFNWFDRPPCMARIIGSEWLAAKLYPDYVKVDLTNDVKSFYKTFFNVDITDAQANTLIGD